MTYGGEFSASETHDFKRSDADETLSDESRHLQEQGLFSGKKRVTLSPDTNRISQDPTIHVRYVQADNSADANLVIGHVTRLTGNATAVRNGVAIILNAGDVVEKGDVVQAGSDSSLDLTFTDGTVLGVSSNARTVLDETVYNPNRSDNSTNDNKPHDAQPKTNYALGSTPSNPVTPPAAAHDDNLTSPDGAPPPVSANVGSSNTTSETSPISGSTSEAPPFSVSTSEAQKFNTSGTNTPPTVAAPLIVSKHASDVVFTTDLLAGASDPDADETTTLSVTNIHYSVDSGAPSMTAPAGVTLGAGSHTLTIDPTDPSFVPLYAGEIRTILVSYDVTDIHGATVAQTETITIIGTNDAPVVTAGLADRAHEGDAAFTRDLLRNAIDPDNGETAALFLTNVKYSVDGHNSSTTPPPGLSLGADGHTLTIDPTNPSFAPLAAGETRTIVVSYNVTDIHGSTVTQTETITITGISNAPVQTLTLADDTVVTPSSGATVYATAATLNAGDSLTGGSGIDVLELVGSGTFNVGQLTNFTGFEILKLDNATNTFANLTLGSQPVEVDATGYLSIYVNSASSWNGSDIVNGDATRSTFLFFNNYNYPSAPVTYDLTANTFAHVYNVQGSGDHLTLLINSADMAGISSFSGSGQDERLVTADASLDLSHTTVAGFTVASTNTLGTTFTVGDLGTAFQIAGGSGNDTLVAQGFTLTADQRTAIFITSSIETITDQTGTYQAPSFGPTAIRLTSSNDTVVTPSSGATVYATAATLNAGDSLTGGSGIDVLELVGSGTFNLGQLTNFTGFEILKLDNATNTFANLTLGSQPVEVDATGYLSIYVNSASNWNGSDIVNGDATRSTFLFFNNYNYPSAPVTYDLTANTFAHVYNVQGSGDHLTLLINSADMAGISSFSGSGQDERLVTADATLDLSHTTVAGFTVASTNGFGTAFTVGDLGTAFQIAGGSGNDTLVAQGFTLTADQRTAIFITSSIETITDQTGTYQAPSFGPTAIRLTSSNDTVVTPSSGATVYATAATLNAGDSLTGGSGTDVLELVGSGTFNFDQLAKFTGFEILKLDNATNTFANLTLGSQPVEVDATGYLSIYVNSASNWNGSDIVNGDATRSTFLFFNNYNYPSAPVTYDLTANTFAHVYNVQGAGDHLTLLINSADMAGISSFSGSGQDERLVTADATLDLSHTMVAGFTVASTNAFGTAFTVGDLGTAFQIAGGSGNDTLVAQGFTLTADQRTAIFVTSSIETITDQTGTYTKSPPPPVTINLTTANDTILTPSSGSIVYATAATLNAGDSLTGGTGIDVLELVGSGTFNVGQLAHFTGFEALKLDNVTNSFASLTLGGQPIKVDATGYLNIQINSPSNWNAGDIVNGDASHSTNLFFGNFLSYPATPLTYDLTSNTFTHLNSIYGQGDNLTLKINNADTTNVASFYGNGQNDSLATADTALDLSHTTVAGFAVTSTNALGTTFTVGDLGTAFQIAGGSGNDTLVAQGFTLTADQRTAIFVTSSIETITDQTGTYQAPSSSPDAIRLTINNDTIITPSSGATVYATAATLNAGDSLTGGTGIDVLELVGSGTFNVGQLAHFTGFEALKLDNVTNSFASLTLGGQPIKVDATGYLNIQINSPSNWNASDIVNGDASHSTNLFFGNFLSYPATPLTYDLTSNTFTHLNSIYGQGDNLTLKINNADTTNVASFYGNGQNDSLATADTALDLSHTTVAGFAVTSTNALGTTFTVGDLGTAFQIAGGSGNDTLVAQGFTLTADQRTAIFVTSSIETITDQTGTYQAPSSSPDAIRLTINNDTIITPSSGATVYATAATLNAGDSLTGGTGIDVLELVGSGTFNVGQLAHFTGFEALKLDNVTNSFASLTLGGQPIKVDATGYLNIQINSPSNWNASDIVSGDASHSTNLFFGNFLSYPATPLTYDLTSNTFTHLNSIYGQGDNLTLKINNADTTNVASFYGNGQNDSLATADTALDLSHTTVAGFAVTSTNALGTTFTVGDLGTAFQIAGGSGNDTLVAQGFTLTADQRTAIFATSSVDVIQDSTGLYSTDHGANLTTNAASQNLVGGSGNDTLIASLSNATLTGNGGSNNFAFKPNFGNATVTDFDTARDTIDLSAVVTTSNLVTWMAAHITQSGTDAVVTIDTADTIGLHKVVTANLNVHDFIVH